VSESTESTVPPPSWWGRYWKVILAMVGIFLAGAVVGGVLTTGVIVKVVKNRLNPENWTENTMAKLDKQLDLSPEQEARIRPIVDEAVLNSQHIVRRAGAAWIKNMVQAQEKVMPILNEEQQAKLREINRQKQENFRKWMMKRRGVEAEDTPEESQAPPGTEPPR